MRRSAVLVSMVLVGVLVAAGCASGSSSDDSSVATAELVGVWSTDDGEVTLEFSDDGETALFTTEHFEECATTYDGDGDEVVVDIECGSLDGTGESSLGGSATRVHTVGAIDPDPFYVARWTLDASELDDIVTPGGEDGLGAPVRGESAAGVPGLISEGIPLCIIEIAEDPSSTVSYLSLRGAMMIRA